MNAAKSTPTRDFPVINHGYAHAFRRDRLTIGLVAPLEAYPDGPVPSMTDHLERVALAERLGFTAVWLRDVPFNVPSFGDAGQLYDPFVYLGALAAHTQRIALGMASVVLPLRHPAHVAKAAASADVLSGGRLLLGVASGDRPDEYPAMNLDHRDRGERFREAIDYLQHMAERRPQFESPYGRLDGTLDMLPKPTAGRLPLLITGGSQQSPEWLAQNGDGWMLYPRPAHQQAQIIAQWRERLQGNGHPDKPVMQPLYVDLLEDDRPATPIHLGLRTGTTALAAHLESLRSAGVNHVAINLRFNRAPFEDTMHRIADALHPLFH